jgi:hypothetical protein
MSHTKGIGPARRRRGRRALASRARVARAGSALLAAAALFAPAAPARAQSKTGTTFGEFIGIGSSARLAAMGNAGTAVGEGIQSVYYNPGAIGATGGTSLQFTHGFWFADIAYDYAAVLFSMGNVGNAFLSVTSLNSGDIDVRTVAQPLGTGEHYSVQNVALGLGYGRQITDRFAAGLQLQYLTETIWHSSADAFTVSVGSSYRLSDQGAILGASLLNFGTKAQYAGSDLAVQYDPEPDIYGNNSALPAHQSTDRFPVPVLFRVGLSYPKRLSETSTLLLTVDAAHPSNNTESLSLGWEWQWRQAFAVRAGYENLAQRDSELGLTAGLGFRTSTGPRHFEFDYAWSYHLTLSETHRLTFVLVL